jgi:phage baseplate assembly protein W
MAVATYKGFSTVGNNFGSSKLTDTDLIKRDLLNHFAIRKGEKLMNGDFGTSIQDLLFDPLTEEIKGRIVQEVDAVIAADPRIVSQGVVLDEFGNGLQIEMQVRYVHNNQVENMIVNFSRPDRELE